MADLLPPSLVEMIVEQERLLLANRRSWHAKAATGRVRSETAEKRLAIAQAILENLRAQADAGTLAALDRLAQEKREKRERRAARKAAGRPASLPPAPPLA